ncbi:MAG: hypothetical protein GX774_14210 [Armatimonadetes bacterium]|nr:hypothetical protein [Armatimonadota bacterium]
MTTTNPSPHKYARAVTLRAVLIGLILMPVNAYWVIQMEMVRYSAHPTTISLFFNAVFTLLVVTLLNRLVARRWPQRALTQGELLVIYTLVALASALCGHDMAQVLVPMITWPFRYATPANRWQELFFEYLPGWLMVSDPEVIRGYYEGNTRPYGWMFVRAWAVPIFFWTLLVTLMLGVMLCVNALVRQQWSNREKLSYPLTHLPLQFTRGGGDGLFAELFRNRLFWIGFAAAAFVDINNGLNLYYPFIRPLLTPGFGQSYLDLGSFFPDRPWRAIGWTPASWYPFMVGLGVTMPLDFLFSAWFFYLFWKLELVGVMALGWDNIPRFPYINDQAFGAYLSFFAFSLWLGRNYLKEVGRKILGRPTKLDDSQEPISYRMAALGIVIGMIGLVLWCWAAGMSPWLAVIFFGIYFALSLAIARMRVELGTPVHDLHFTGPDWTLTEICGPAVFGPRNLAVFSLFFWFNRAYRCHPMPSQIEGFRMAEQTRSSQRAWFWLLLAGGTVAMLVAFWAMLHLMYAYGAAAKSGSFGAEAYNRLATWITNPPPADRNPAIAVGVGFAIAAFLQYMRVRLPWWPFHPLGFAVTASWEINLVWMPLFIAWLLKMVILS